MDEIPRRLLVAIGGNAIHPADIRGTSDEQKAIAASTAHALLPLAELDNELVITHGNGPVVGKILMRQVLTCDRIAPKVDGVLRSFVVTPHLHPHAPRIAQTVRER